MDKNETPENFDALVLQMVELVKEGNRWGKANGYPLFEKYPQYNEVQEIGKKFFEMGGRELMQKAYATVAAYVSWAEMSEHWWDGIGGWHG